MNQSRIFKETVQCITLTLVIATLPFLVYLVYLYTGGVRSEPIISIIFYSIITGVILVKFTFNYFYYWSILGNGEKMFEDWNDFEDLLAKTKLSKKEVLTDSIKEMYTLANLLFAVDLAACTKNYFQSIAEPKAILFTVMTIAIMTTFSYVQRIRVERRIAFFTEDHKNKE